MTTRTKKQPYYDEEEHMARSSVKTGTLSYEEARFVHNLVKREKELEQLLLSTKFKEKHGFTHHGAGWLLKEIVRGVLLTLIFSIFGTFVISMPTAILANIIIAFRLVAVEVANITNKILTFAFKVWSVISVPVRKIIKFLNYITYFLRKIGIPVHDLPYGFTEATMESILPSWFKRFLDIPNVCKYYNTWNTVLIGIFYVFSADWFCPVLRAGYAVPMTRPVAKLIYLNTDLMAPVEYGGRNCSSSLTDVDCILLGTGFVLRDLVLPNVYFVLWLYAWWPIISWIVSLVVRYVNAYYYDYIHQLDKFIKAAHEQTKYEISGVFETPAA